MTVHRAPRPTAHAAGAFAPSRARATRYLLEMVPWTGLCLILAVSGLLLIVALPHSESVERALAVERMELEVHRGLRQLRQAVRDYRAEHGSWPGWAPLPPDQQAEPAPSSRWLVHQLLANTDQAGNCSRLPSPAHTFGPYLKGRIPANAANGLASVRVLNLDEPLPLGADGMSGWVYDAPTGELRANSEGRLRSSGIRFYDL